MSRVQMPATRPYWLRLAIATASSTSSNVDDRQHRAEDLFLRDAHVRRHAIEQRRLEVEAAAERRIRRPRAAGGHARAFLRADRHVAFDRLELLLRDDRPHVGIAHARARRASPSRVRRAARRARRAPSARRAGASRPSTSGRRSGRSRWRRPATARSRSASAKTMFGDLPPSSITTGTTLSAAILATAMPTSTEPVNVS